MRLTFAERDRKIIPVLLGLLVLSGLCIRAASANRQG
jgi:hypothetical protein